MGLANVDAILVSRGSSARLSVTATASIRSTSSSVCAYQPMAGMIARLVAVVRVWWCRAAIGAPASRASQETSANTLTSMTAVFRTPRPVAPTRRFKNVYVGQTSNAVRTPRVSDTKCEVGTTSVST
eukprot:GILJ01000541.1.p2 GENE.GILJ01000541.1~~GILJ01000541.1.p2  ORF type:complete len:127 (+),score=11.04 GILJ01000541.1:569-949(+)